MLFGAHVSIARGIPNAPINAKQLGCETFQMFTRSPQGGLAINLTDQAIVEFKKNCQSAKFTNYYIHAPYYINLASVKKRIYFGSITTIRKELDLGSKIKAKYVMFHPGSAKDVAQSKGITLVIEGLKKILEGYEGTTELLIENSAGAGSVVGDKFEEIARIIKGVNHLKLSGVCLDTAHSFESGYDWHGQAGANKTLTEFGKVLGFSRLKMIHANDSKTELGSHSDRHEHLGKGEIGLDSFRAIVKHPKLQNIDLILETPADQGGYRPDLRILRKLRAEK
ncbi:deoxyribonuclease IV [Patescibacteria group bacterium]|nr:deoxyribonuclease IV [Patescibacteria group bacterium]